MDLLNKRKPGKIPPTLAFRLRSIRYTFRTYFLVRRRKMKWTPDLIIAVILVVGCLALLFTGIDGEVKSILTIAAGWCFGSQYQARTIQKTGNKKPKEK